MTELQIPVSPSEKDLNRFWSKVDRTGACWTWQACKMANGYGRFSMGRGNVYLAHRFAYTVTKGEIPAGLQLDHLCRNRSCVNPDHLEAVPGAVNTRRGGESLKTRCPRGHRYDRFVAGTRRCRKCDNETSRRYHARTKARAD